MKIKIVKILIYLLILFTALHLYKKVGFYATGEVENDELVMRNN